MMRECGAPRVQYQGCADLCAEMSGIGGNGAQGLGGYIKQQAVDHRLVVPGDRADCRRQGEDHVVVLHGQQIGLTRLEPAARGAGLALWAMAITTGVEGDVDPCGSSKTERSWRGSLGESGGGHTNRVALETGLPRHDLTP